MSDTPNHKEQINCVLSPPTSSSKLKTPEEALLDAAQLYEAFHTPLRIFIARRLREEAAVEDLLQEVFVRAHTQGHSLRDGERLRAWLFRLTRNVIIDHQRKQGAQARSLERFSLEPSKEETLFEDPEEGFAALLLAAGLRPLIATLPEPYRQALRWTELEGLTQAEAAKLAKISLSGMKSRVQRGRKLLKSALLECCAVELDSRNRVIDFEPRTYPSCGSDPKGAENV